ncbi:outer membrane beta-barrel protein [Roseiarcaceae bacterium H3SJ34-1]|uniref:outer membrane protein n=1 Tax=Terripilifer ovatus TaxID=3032367 RepID=UPI003AB91A3B|nr:outer membrane beta-barrel protein [Roseiarcaceae bacterium H3SJ34-1]
MVRWGSMTFAAAFAAIATVGAHAADLDFPNAPPSLTPEVPVELGTGWYLRGDVGYAREQMPQLSVNATAVPAGAQLLNSLGSKNGWSAGLGFGYKFNNWFRTDFTFERRNTIKSDATSGQFDCQNQLVGLNDAVTNDPVAIGVLYNKCTAAQTASLTRSVSLANFYVDLGNWSGVTPYVGAGVGFVYGATQGTYNWYNAADGSYYNPTLTLPSGYPLTYIHYDSYLNPVTPQPVNFGPQSRLQISNTRTFAFAWALMAGFSYDISSHMKLDINYRYLNMGKWTTPTASSIAKSSDVRIGVRYMID